jgi:hypothetical protein
MALGSGQAGQLGWGVESTPGTAVTPTKFAVINGPAKAGKLDITMVQGEGINAGRLFPQEGRHVHTTKSVSGQFSTNLVSKGLGTLVRAMLGASQSTPTVLTGSAYEYVATPGDKQSAGSSLTIQQGVVRLDGTVNPYTWRGCKIPAWELSCSVDGIAELSVDFDGWDEVTATALATASFPVTEQFTGVQMAVNIGGTPATSSGKTSLTSPTALSGVKGVTVKGSDPMNTERFYANAAGVKAEQVRNALAEYAVELDMDYLDRAVIYDLAAANTSTALQIAWTGSLITGAHYNLFEITIPKVKFEIPDLDGDGADTTGQKVVAKVVEEQGSSHNTFQIRQVNTDTTL